MKATSSGANAFAFRCEAKVRRATRLKSPPRNRSMTITLRPHPEHLARGGRWIRVRGDVLRFLGARQTVTVVESPTVHDGANQAANDNNTPAPDISSALDLILSAEDDNIEDRVRRTERLGIVVVVIMAIGLAFAPALFVALTLGI
ncbi:mll8096 [Mesorhizobium japonicum MAFF 303099]|uniref:Mll8096 protein n=1 Tax=Mesorhizobium japonicum (strain LMG 29417 / CECT 9101 / MAFF 303099) TaxID=266835 RepID=Q983Z5_RHILO|nr:mll8096 [Mesorhizobium japonicum MAFF 303099]